MSQCVYSETRKPNRFAGIRNSRRFAEKNCLSIPLVLFELNPREIVQYMHDIQTEIPHMIRLNICDL